MEIISIDWGNGKDYTAASLMCGRCKTIFETQTIRRTDYIPVKIYKECPRCKAKFKEIKVLGGDTH